MRLLASTALLTALTAAPAPAFQGCQGCTPLDDLGTGLYLGLHQGGLYSGGLNTPPPGHRDDALAAASSVVPRNANGTPDPAGRIGLISVSMSNCNQEFSAFERRADGDDHRNGRLFVVNGCQGGQALNVIANPNAPYWTNLAERLDAAGLAPGQVQAVWLKMADAQPRTTAFPDHALEGLANATAVLQNLKALYPNLALAFFSSRTYGGYGETPQHGEPLCYETGFAVKWLIEKQIAGEPGLNHDPNRGPVVAPVALWGPYLWANGAIPRSDGLVWLRSDFEDDGVHPSPAGEQKVADLLEAFHRFDRFSTGWFGRPSAVRLETLAATDDATVDAAQPSANHGSAPALRLLGTQRRAYLRFDLSSVSGTVEEAKLSLLTPEDFTSHPGTQLRGVSSTSWSEDTLTFANAPPMDGGLIAELPTLSRGTATSFDVTSQVQAALGGAVAFGLASDPGASGPMEFLSEEGGAAPRLVLSVRPPCDDPGVPYCRSLPNSAGTGASMAMNGSASVTTNDLMLGATGLPANVPALFYYGFGSAQLPLGEGLRCVAGPIARLNPPQFSGLGGSVQRALDFTTFPLGAGPMAVAPGDLLHVQCWFRDVTGGPEGFNLSDARQVELCP